jgi:hypothetical protein
MLACFINMGWFVFRNRWLFRGRGLGKRYNHQAVKKLFFNVFDQRAVIATGQVGTANAVPEQYIAAYQDVCRFIIKTQMSG